MMTLLYVLHFMVCFILIGVVLLQRGKGSDIGAALGGGGANTVFGSRGAGNFLTRITTGSAIVFMCTSLSLAYVGTHHSRVDLFDGGDVGTTAPAPSPLEPAADPTGAPNSGGLEEIPAKPSGGLEEIPAPESKKPANP
ncbi:MAG: preprotein translocase subunit SecG [bacterium TMED88]|nr:preprotein translocase subunit SecG [Deltaproteobacteria bacterium]OUV31685.1 MAG: preprotein translocase subunit SecG [bacterium TMED88]